MGSKGSKPAESTVSLDHPIWSHRVKIISTYSLDSNHNESSTPKVGQNLGRQKERKQLYFEDGSKYEGEIENGKMHGLGVLTWSNGAQYTGQFKENSLMGKGKFIHANGSRSEGDFKDGGLNGLVKQYDSSGVRVFEGSFKDTKRCGHGKEYRDNTDIPSYVGMWKNNVKCGQGQTNNKDGSYAVGVYNENRCCHGKFYDTTGFMNFEGEFSKEGVAAKGKFFFKDGSWFEGELKNAQRHALIKETEYDVDDCGGYGKYYDKKGVLVMEGYIGEFKAGLVHQRIKEFNASGRPGFEGFHENDESSGYHSMLKVYVKSVPAKGPVRMG